jgi:hypothetical protein
VLKLHPRKPGANGSFKFIYVCVSTLVEIKNGVWGNSFPQNEIYILWGSECSPNYKILIFWGEKNLSPDPTHFIYLPL